MIRRFAVKVIAYTFHFCSTQNPSPILRLLMLNYVVNIGWMNWGGGGESSSFSINC